MAEWIAFDDATVSALSARTLATVKLGTGNALEAALATDVPCMLLLPNQAGQAQVLTLRRFQTAPRESAPAYVATGFLGLLDEEVASEEETPPKSWWQKLWK
jgi:hypothetical protein